MKELNMEENAKDDVIWDVSLRAVGRAKLTRKTCI
jgi:hypothetical protein